MPIYAIPLVYESYADSEELALEEAKEFAAEHIDIGYIGSPVFVTVDLDEDEDARYLSASVEVNNRGH